MSGCIEKGKVSIWLIINFFYLFYCVWVNYGCLYIFILLLVLIIFWLLNFTDIIDIHLTTY